MTNSEETNKIYDNIIQIMNKTKEENSTFLSEKNKKINQKLSLIEKTLFKKNEEIKKVYVKIKQENEKNIRKNVCLNLLKSSLEFHKDDIQNYKNVLYSKYHYFSQFKNFYENEIKEFNNKENKINEINSDFNEIRIKNEIENYINLYQKISGISFKKIDKSKIKIQLFLNDNINSMFNDYFIILEYVNFKFYKIIEIEPKINLDNYNKSISGKDLPYFISSLIQDLIKFLQK